MMEAVRRLPANQRRRLAEALEVGLLSLPGSIVQLQSVLGTREGVDPLIADLASLEALGLNSRAAAVWIGTIEDPASDRAKPDLVWSGPEVPGVYARDTRRVFEELLRSAQHSVWVCTFAYFDGPKAFEELSQRMDAVAQLNATLLLNIQRRRGDTTAASDLVRRFADRFWGHDWPGSSRPRVFYDPRSVELDGPTGVLHAKAIVADDEVVLVTSANLTEAALDRNFELGLLVRDRALAASVVSHFAILIDRELLKPLPAA